MNIFTIYTDASVNDKFQIGVSGYLIFLNDIEIKHELILMENLSKINLAEIKAIEFALEYIFETQKENKGLINVKTDHRGIVEAKNPLQNKNLKKVNTLTKILEENKFTIVIEHIKGHAGNKNHDRVDRSCRKFLREYLKTFKPMEIKILKRIDYKELKENLVK